MVSEEGLNAYGASTWGQFFIYQGFNDHAGWMHTSSGVDAVDEYLETVTKQGDHYVYKVGAEERPVIESTITVPYKTDKGMASKTFTVYRTHHGPVTRESNGKWVTTALMNKPIEALTESYTRTKATNYKTFLKTMDLFANSSNNTIFADSDGDIAYFHGNFIPRRDPSFDWKQPVDGSNPATDWKGLLTVDETPHLLNPESGWIYNSNDSPWEGSGPSSLKKADYPGLRRERRRAPRAAGTRYACSRTRRTSRSTASSAPRTTAIRRGSRSRFRRSSRRGTRCRPATR